MNPKCIIDNDDCSVAGKIAKGMCETHYQRQRKYGDPHVVLKPRVKPVRHGLWRTPTYNSWANMITRCTNENHSTWPEYGGRGITICDRWRNSFENFLADMGERPEGTSLDRIDPEGNYEPGNCRWASKSAQNHNRRPRRGTTSRFTGVNRREDTGKWQAAIMVDYRLMSLGSFASEEEAARARDAKVIELGLPAPLNFPTRRRIVRRRNVNREAAA
jgi:hypothetical protein